MVRSEAESNRWVKVRSEMGEGEEVRARSEVGRVRSEVIRWRHYI